MKTTWIVALLLALPLPGIAQERSPLTRDELSELFVGKVVMTTRLRDNRIGRFDVRKNGYVFYNNETNGFADSGRWELKDDGAICFQQWRSPANFDLCMHLYRTGAGVIEASYSPEKPADERITSTR